MTRSRALIAVLIATAGLACAAASAGAATPPKAVTQSARNLTFNSAVVTGAVNPAGVDTTYYFQYGTTTAYSARSAGVSAGNGTSGIAVNATLQGLTASTTYHYRLVAVSSAGTTRGADKTLKTTAPVIPESSKMALARATINSTSNYIDILAPITGLASGYAQLELYGAHQVHRWSAKVSGGSIRTRETIPGPQAELGTGILTIAYPGDADTRPQTVRLRAANVHAALNTTSRPAIGADGHLRANGTISAAAKGQVRVQLEYFSGGVTTTLEKYAPITNGAWTLDYQLAPAEQAAINARKGTVESYVLFTGYLAAKMRGEMQAFEVLGAP